MQICFIDDFIPIDKKTQKPIFIQNKNNKIWGYLL